MIKQYVIHTLSTEVHIDVVKTSVDNLESLIVYVWILYQLMNISMTYKQFFLLKIQKLTYI